MGRSKQISMLPKNELLRARGALIRRRGDNRRHANTRQSRRRARERKHASARRTKPEILIARYGAEGREYIHVEETMPHSEVYPGPLKPTDELIAVNGKVIMEPTEARFKDLQKAILRCPRPLKLTFIHVPCGVLVIASTASRER